MVCSRAVSFSMSLCQAPMSVKFEIPYFTVSGVTVRQGRVHSEWRQCYRPVKPLGTWRLLRSLVTRHRRHRHDLRHSITAVAKNFDNFESPNSVTDYSKRFSQALPWVRYITQNGDYQLRMAWIQVDNSLFWQKPCSGYSDNCTVHDDNCDWRIEVSLQLKV